MKLFIKSYLMYWNYVTVGLGESWCDQGLHWKWITLKKTPFENVGYLTMSASFPRSSNAISKMNKTHQRCVQLPWSIRNKTVMPNA